jgi:hypothetical protein
MEFLSEVQDVVAQVHLQPLLKHATWWSWIGLGAIAIWDIIAFLFPDIWEYCGNWILLLAVFGISSILFSTGCLIAFSVRRYRTASWFNDMKLAIRNELPFQALLDMDASTIRREYEGTRLQPSVPEPS